LGPGSPAPCAQDPKIQVPYLNTFQSLWEYKESFLAGQIDFALQIGPACPLCGRLRCYRKMAPYWRYAIELFPEFKKERIPIGRFLCRRRQRTFSFLPVQLIPYFQYTVGAVLGTLLLGWGCFHRGQEGFWGASVEVDPDSLVTPWLVAFWLAAVLRGLRRGHAVLARFYDLTGIGTPKRASPWEEAAGYFQAFGLKSKIYGLPLFLALAARYSRTTKQFLFGIPSQQRNPNRP
jgi:hypothetical protein